MNSSRFGQKILYEFLYEHMPLGMLFARCLIVLQVLFVAVVLPLGCSSVSVGLWLIAVSRHEYG
jgi:hypothetical protein